MVFQSSIVFIAVLALLLPIEADKLCLKKHRVCDPAIHSAIAKSPNLCLPGTIPAKAPFLGDKELIRREDAIWSLCCGMSVCGADIIRFFLCDPVEGSKPKKPEFCRDCSLDKMGF
ncbi:hypothetical protein L596_000401 [Steinernema carpocapsae]|uniref:Uncharacterized protein n=1 Tax=Steinernema carpocapsae TaxID=34508 RepID=A0A4U8UIW5_STECR|nr:hypothetical protein L596_000401 [Steinernema carpocapsae]